MNSVKLRVFVTACRVFQTKIQATIKIYFIVADISERTPSNREAFLLGLTLGELKEGLRRTFGDCDLIPCIDRLPEKDNPENGVYVGDYVLKPYTVDNIAMFEEVTRNIISKLW